MFTETYENSLGNFIRQQFESYMMTHTSELEHRTTDIRTTKG